MHISVHYAGEDAVTADERSRIHTNGRDTGTFYNSHFIDERPVVAEDGTMDFTEAYLEALRKFFIEEPRAAEGKAFEISIIA
jgi:hypothetical protein